jgi:hypothetical protein
MASDESVTVFEVRVNSRYIDGHFFTESSHEVHDDLTSHFDGLRFLEPGQSWKVTIASPDGDTTSIEIDRVTMKRSELSALPEWDGY